MCMASSFYFQQEESFWFSFLKCSSFAKLKKSFFFANFWNSFLWSSSSSLSLLRKSWVVCYLISLFSHRMFVFLLCFSSCLALFPSIRSLHYSAASSSSFSLFHLTGLHACALDHSSESFSYPIIHLLLPLMKSPPAPTTCNGMHCTFFKKYI